jgi:hypothetical protein
MIRLPKNLLLMTLGLVLIGSVGGCDFKLTMMDGYRFTYDGIQKQKRERNQFESGLSQLHVENRFGNVTVVPADERGPSWSLAGQSLGRRRDDRRYVCWKS